MSGEEKRVAGVAQGAATGKGPSGEAVPEKGSRSAKASSDKGSRKPAKRAGGKPPAKGGAGAKAAAKKGRSARAAGASAGKERRPRSRPREAAGGAQEGAPRLTRRRRRAVFFQALAPDFALTFLVAVSLVLTAAFAFKTDEAVSRNLPLACGAVCALLVPMFAGTWSKRAVVPAALATAAIGLVMIGIGVSTSGAENFMADSAENNTVFAFVVVVTTVIVFLLSRRPVGMAFLLIGGVFTCGLVQFLYEGWLVIEAAVFLVAVLVLFIYKVYQRSIYEAEVARKTSFAGAAGFALMLTVVFTLIGTGVFYGIIEPLAPGAQELKLIQERYALEVVYYTGTFDASDHPNDDQTSNDTNDEQRQTGDDADGQGEGDETGDQSDAADENDQLESQNTFSINGVTLLPTLSYEQLQLMGLIIAILLVLALATAVLVRRAIRERRLRKIAGEPAAYRVAWIYGFLEGRFARIGFKRPASMTPQEFADASRRGMLAFEEGCDSSWPRMTDLYYKAYYGSGGGVTAADVDEAEGFYRAFFRNARKQVGKVKWIWKFWRV